MSKVRKSISLTGQQADWIKTQISAGYYGSKSKAIRGLISERQIREQKTPEEIHAIRATLTVGEESINRDGYSRKTVDEIWKEAKGIHKERHG